MELSVNENTNLEKSFTQFANTNIKNHGKKHLEILKNHLNHDIIWKTKMF